MNTDSSNKNINIIIADKSEIYLDALQRLIKHHKDIVLRGMFDSMNNLNSVLNNTVIDVLIIDTIMFESNTLENIKDIKQQYPTLKIIVLSMDDSIHLREKIIDAGAHECLYKLNQTDKLFEAIRFNL